MVNCNESLVNMSLIISLLQQMIGLSPGRQVFIYSSLLDTARAKKSCTSMACYLLSCFYKDTEMRGCNLTGFNNKTALDRDIIDSIVGELNMYFVTVNMPQLLGLLRFNTKSIGVQTQN